MKIIAIIFAWPFMLLGYAVGFGTYCAIAGYQRCHYHMTKTFPPKEIEY